MVAERVAQRIVPQIRSGRPHPGLLSQGEGIPAARSTWYLCPRREAGRGRHDGVTPPSPQHGFHPHPNPPPSREEGNLPSRTVPPHPACDRSLSQQKEGAIYLLRRAKERGYWRWFGPSTTLLILALPVESALRRSAQGVQPRQVAELPCRRLSFQRWGLEAIVRIRVDFRRDGVAEHADALDLDLDDVARLEIAGREAVADRLAD